MTVATSRNTKIRRKRLLFPRLKWSLCKYEREVQEEGVKNSSKNFSCHVNHLLIILCGKIYCALMFDEINWNVSSVWSTLDNSKYCYFTHGCYMKLPCWWVFFLLNLFILLIFWRNVWAWRQSGSPKTGHVFIQAPTGKQTWWWRGACRLLRAKFAVVYWASVNSIDPFIAGYSLTDCSPTTSRSKPHHWLLK